MPGPTFLLSTEHYTLDSGWGPLLQPPRLGPNSLFLVSDPSPSQSRPHFLLGVEPGGVVGSLPGPDPGLQRRVDSDALAPASAPLAGGRSSSCKRLDAFTNLSFTSSRPQPTFPSTTSARALLLELTISHHP